MIFVPVGREQAHELRTGHGPLPQQGFASTSTMLRAHGLTDEVDEAAYTAQAYAMTHGLLSECWPSGERLVLAADVPDRFVSDGGDEFGGVRLSGFEWGWVTAVFSDGATPASDVRRAVTDAARALAGRSLAEAVDAPALEGLLEDHDLLWFLPEESW